MQVPAARVDILRALDVGAYGARVNASSDGGLVLWPYHLRGLAERREALLAWVAECERRYGEDVYSWP